MIFTQPFTADEYTMRLNNVHEKMAESDLEVLIVTDPSNMNYLSGYDGWSFHQPQCFIVALGHDVPHWVGRGTELSLAKMTTGLGEKYLHPYPEECFIQCNDYYPFDYVSELLSTLNLDKRNVGIESQSYLMNAQAYQSLIKGLPNSTIRDAQWLVEGVRAIKSKQELTYMDQGARILESAMQTAFEAIEPGAKQCDVAAKVITAQTVGVDGYHGDYPSVVPLMATGGGTSTPHLTWSSDTYQKDALTIIEIAGCRHRYHVPMGRTLYIGQPPQKLLDAVKYSVAALHAALDAAKPGALCEDVEVAWRKEIVGSELIKTSRVGYCIGLGYPPDWCGNNMSFYPGDKTEIQEGMTFHLMPGIWMDDWGMEISEPFQVTANGAKLFADVTQDLFVK